MSITIMSETNPYFGHIGKRCDDLTIYYWSLISIIEGVPAVAPWFRLRLSSCGPRFESQAHHLRIFEFILLKLKYYLLME